MRPVSEEPGVAGPEVGRRDRKKQATRQALRDAALRLFLEKGYEDTTIADIAEEADTSDRTFYRHFASKEDLLLADARGYFEDVERIIATRPTDEPPMASLLAVRAELAATWDLGESVRWLFDLIVEHRAVQANLLLLIADHESRLADLFAERMGLPGTDPRPWLVAGAAGAAFTAGIVLDARNAEADVSAWEYGELALRAYARGLDRLA